MMASIQDPSTPCFVQNDKIGMHTLFVPASTPHKNIPSNFRRDGKEQPYQLRSQGHAAD